MCHYKALISTLDDQCLSFCEINIHTREKKNDSKMHSMPTGSEKAIQVSNAPKPGWLKLKGSQSSLNSIAGSNFNFGDETL